MMRQLRSHMHGGELFSARLPKIIGDLMKSNQDQHLRPEVERTATQMMEEREKELALKSKRESVKLLKIPLMEFQMRRCNEQ